MRQYDTRPLKDVSEIALFTNLQRKFEGKLSGAVLGVGSHLIFSNLTVNFRLGNCLDNIHRQGEFTPSSGHWQQVGQDLTDLAFKSRGDVRSNQQGTIIAIGVQNMDMRPGYVRAWQWGVDTGEWIQMGQDIQRDDREMGRVITVQRALELLTMRTGISFRRVKLQERNETDW